MSTTEVVQFACIITLMAGSYWWFWTWGDREQQSALRKMKSAAYPVAQTGSMFVPSFDPYVTKTGTVYLPVTDGLYATRIASKKRRRYHEGLQDWLKRGAQLRVFVTQPGAPNSHDRCLEEWGPFLNAYRDQFQVLFLYRERAEKPEIKTQIARLDTFHPVILVDSDEAARPGVMWIEQHHPIGSKYAYDVKFLDPADTAKDGRLPIYQHMYEGLLEGPHVKTITPVKH